MAVYTDVTDQELDAFMAEYEIGKATSYKGIAEGVENSNYLVHTDSGRYILTLYEKRVELADLPYYLGLMDHLSTAGFPCPRPIHGTDGEALRRLAGRPAAVTSFLDGVCRRSPTVTDCAEIGAAMARMHKAGEGFSLTRPNALSVNGWRPLHDSLEGRANEIDDGLGAVLAAELDYLDKVWPGDLPTGNIHADLFPDNVFFLDKKLTGIIDFYFACTDFLAYELGVALNAWCFEPDGAFNVTKARRMLAAYQSLRPLETSERAALPTLARGAALRFLLTRSFDWLNRVEGALVTPKDPREFLARLRFHQGVAHPSAYGIED